MCDTRRATRKIRKESAKTLFATDMPVLLLKCQFRRSQVRKSVVDKMSITIFQRGVGERRAALSATHLPRGIAQTGRRIRVRDASLGWSNLTPASQQAWDQVVRVRVHRVPFDHAQRSTVNFTPLTEFPTRVVSYPNSTAARAHAFLSFCAKVGMGDREYAGIRKPTRITCITA